MTPCAGFEHRLGERPGRVEPAAVEADVELAAVDPVDRQPVDEIGIGRPAEPAASATQAAIVWVRQARPPIAPSIRARACESSQSGASSSTASSRSAERHQRPHHCSSASTAGAAAATTSPSSSAISVSMP